MKVKVELTGSRNSDGLKSLVSDWEARFPTARLIGLNAWASQIDMQLEMPASTQVILPQIIDARSTVEGGAS